MAPTSGAGVYTLPAGYEGVTGQTIQVSQHNPPLEDIQAALTARLMRNGAGAMTGALKLADGTIGAPSLTFATELTSGFYKITGGYAAGVSGSQVARFSNGVFGFVDGGDLASAAALTLGTGNIFNITGTTAITSIGTKGVGTLVWLRFAAALTLTHHSTDLILTTGANITTAAGDWALFEEYATGDWRMVFYQRATGAAIRSSLPRGYIDGCVLSNGTDAINDINIAAGVCRDSTNSVDITVAAMAGKQLDANWAPGANAGMRNSAAAIANESYHIFAVSKADGTQDIYAHSSGATATALASLQLEPGGADYVYIRRIGSILRAASSILGFVQEGDHFLLNPARDETFGAISGTSAVSQVVSVPGSYKHTAHIRAALIAQGTAVEALISSLDTSDVAPGTGSAARTSLSSQTTGVPDVAELNVRTNASSQIRYRVTTASGPPVLRITTLGWTDRRGRDE